ASGTRCTKELLALTPRPDAIFVSNAQMACGALHALESMRVSCPDEVALACFDQLDFFDLLRPRLACVAAPSYDLGAIGAQFILKRIAGTLTGCWRRRLVPATLVHGESAGRRPTRHGRTPARR
ncbi:MAG TPA: substrate-binding domain-containing protein, partial [Candidatus Dormibacteraeota bacterium]|nr:substrate-binding domain-containing protein [Candidatus Dormibacteraeota bacterium]